MLLPSVSGPDSTGDRWLSRIIRHSREELVIPDGIERGQYQYEDSRIPEPGRSFCCRENEPLSPLPRQWHDASGEALVAVGMSSEVEIDLFLREAPFLESKKTVLVPKNLFKTAPGPTVRQSVSESGSLSLGMSKSVQI